MKLVNFFLSLLLRSAHGYPQLPLTTASDGLFVYILLWSLKFRSETVFQSLSDPFDARRYDTISMTYLWSVLIERFELLLEATVFVIVHLLAFHFGSFGRLPA